MNHTFQQLLATFYIAALATAMVLAVGWKKALALTALGAVAAWLLLRCHRRNTDNDPGNP